jgi:hypothetical protein
MSYLVAPQGLRESLARSRQGGKAFDEAWEAAIAAARAHDDDLSAIEGQRHIWGRAYAGAPRHREELPIVKLLDVAT